MNNIAGKTLISNNNTSNSKKVTNLKEQEEKLLVDLIYKEKKIEGFRDKGPSVKSVQQIKYTSLSELAAKSGKIIEEREDKKANVISNPPENKEAYVKKHVNAGTYIDLKSLQSLGNKGSSR